MSKGNKSVPNWQNCSLVKNKHAQIHVTISKNRFADFPIIHVLQMLRKSVETRDWLNTIEPRNVRAVMKRVIEDISAIDTQVGQLYEEGTRKERSSDSSRRTHPQSYSVSTAQRKGQWNIAPRYVSVYWLRGNF